LREEPWLNLLLEIKEGWRTIAFFPGRRKLGERIRPPMGVTEDGLATQGKTEKKEGGGR